MCILYACVYVQVNLLSKYLGRHAKSVLLVRGSYLSVLNDNLYMS